MPKPLSRNSILDRARNADVNGSETLRDIAVNQFLVRLELGSPSTFMLKGGQALRSHGISDRTTRDVDMRGDLPHLEQSIALAIAAAKTNLGDGIQYVLTSEPTPLAALATGGYAGVSMAFAATIQGKWMAVVSMDLVTGRRPSGQVIVATRPLAVEVPGVTPVALQTYPIEDHIADKFWATMTPFSGRPSTRVRDLYDLCAFALRSAPSAQPLSIALEEERVRRGLAATPNFASPREWEPRWPALFTKYPDGGIPHTLDDATRLARSLVDPIVRQEVTEGTWNAEHQRWAM